MNRTAFFDLKIIFNIYRNVYIDIYTVASIAFAN